MPRLTKCPYCDVWMGPKHRCPPRLTTRQAWRALQNADTEHVEEARSEFAHALERVGT